LTIFTDFRRFLPIFGVFLENQCYEHF
jgi:hypothetical protein